MQSKIRSTGRPIDFIIIGAMKCGTSQLYSLLFYNKCLNLATIKEPNFFNHQVFHGKWQLGLAWYEKLFEGRAGLRGEASTSYTKRQRDDGVAARIHATNSSARLIYTVRDPVDRAISHYLHNALGGREKRDISSALLEGPSAYLNTGLYYYQLIPYLRLFPKEQLLVLQAETLWANTAEQLNRVCEFIGVPPVTYSPGLRTRKNALLSHVHRFMKEKRSGLDLGEAQYLLHKNLSKFGYDASLSSSQLANRLGFGPRERGQLWESFRADSHELEREFPGVSRNWSV